MAALNLTQQNIIDNAYYILEQDSTLWATDSDEYETAKGLLNIGIGRWENYDDAKWKELYGTLTAAATGTKTTTAGTYDYACPDNMKFPSSFVRTVDANGTSIYWDVKTVEEVAKFVKSTDRYVYFTGNLKDGFTLNFNPNLTLTTGDTINYEYYKKATLTTTTTSQVEMSDPYFLSYYIASHMSEGGADPNLNNMAETRLEAMRTQNMTGLFGVDNNIEPSLNNYTGFGQ